MEATNASLPDLLRSFRKAAGLTQAQLAERLCAATGTWTLTRHEVGRWEQGRVRPGAWLPALAEVLNVDLELLKQTPSRLAASYVDSGEEGRQVREVLRRTFLKQGVRLAALPAVVLDQGQRVIEALEVLCQGRLGGVADGLGELIDYYTVTICSVPPGDVYGELLAIRSYTGEILDRADNSPRGVDLALHVGWLSQLLAVAACDLGEHAAARLWCSDAERRSREARCPDLAAWSMLTRSMIAFYQGQPRHSAVLAAQGQGLVPIGTVSRARLASQEMRAAAMAGDAVRMTRAKDHAAQAIAGLPADVPVTGAFSIALAEDPPYTATSLLLVGRFREAVDATNRVIRTVYQPEAGQRGEHPSGYARSLLILGLAYAGLGNLDEAAAAGQAALAGSRPVWPTLVLADKLDRVLVHDFSGAAQAADYHARYLETKRVSAGDRIQP